MTTPELFFRRSNAPGAPIEYEIPYFTLECTETTCPHINECISTTTVTTPRTMREYRECRNVVIGSVLSHNSHGVFAFRYYIVFVKLSRIGREARKRALFIGTNPNAKRTASSCNSQTEDQFHAVWSEIDSVQFRVHLANNMGGLLRAASKGKVEVGERAHLIIRIDCNSCSNVPVARINARHAYVDEASVIMSTPSLDALYIRQLFNHQTSSVPLFTCHFCRYNVNAKHDFTPRGIDKVTPQECTCVQDVPVYCVPRILDDIYNTIIV